MSKSKMNQKEMTSKKNPFKVPENYFDNLEKEILSNKPKKHIAFSSSMVLKYAAMVLLAIGIGTMVFYTLPINKENNIIARQTQDSFYNNSKIISTTQENEAIEELLLNQEKFVEEHNVENIEFSEQEYEYLEYYLHGDYNSYLTYNELDL